jgi:hypothetical protein
MLTLLAQLARLVRLTSLALLSRLARLAGPVACLARLADWHGRLVGQPGSTVPGLPNGEAGLGSRAGPDGPACRHGWPRLLALLALLTGPAGHVGCPGWLVRLAQVAARSGGPAGRIGCQGLLARIPRLNWLDRLARPAGPDGPRFCPSAPECVPIGPACWPEFSDLFVQLARLTGRAIWHGWLVQLSQQTGSAVPPVWLAPPGRHCLLARTALPAGQACWLCWPAGWPRWPCRMAGTGIPANCPGWLVRLGARGAWPGCSCIVARLARSTGLLARLAHLAGPTDPSVCPV